MTKNIIAAAALGMAALGLGSCGKNGGFETTKDGLQYKIIKGEGKDEKKAGKGDIVQAHIKVYLGDSLFFDSRSVKLPDGTVKAGDPIEIPVQELKYKFQPDAGFTMLRAGDSGVFRVPVDSFKRRGEKMPPWMKAKDFIEYRIKMLAIKTQEQVQQERMAKSTAQKATDDSSLQDYFHKNNISPMKTANGVYYTIDVPGSGDNIKAGQEATVIYTGKLMNGTEFDSNDPKTHPDKKPFVLKVGQGMVIPGWDEGLQMFKKGGKGKLYIPSSLAYGPQGMATIPANANLIFDIEIKDVK